MQANLELLHETMLACARTVDEIKARADMFYATVHAFIHQFLHVFAGANLK